MKSFDEINSDNYKVFFITLGYYSKNNTYYETLTNNLEEFKSDKIYLYFFYGDKNMIDKTLSFLREKNFDFDYEECFFDDVEDFQEIFIKLDQAKIGDCQLYDFIKNYQKTYYLDFTAGTKSMSAVIFNYFVFYGNNNLKLIYSGGKRDSGIVKQADNIIKKNFQFYRFYLFRRNLYRMLIEEKNFENFKKFLEDFNVKLVNESLYKTIDFYDKVFKGELKEALKLKFSNSEFGSFNRYLNTFKRWIESYLKNESELEGNKKNIWIFKYFFEMMFTHDRLKIKFIQKDYNFVLALFYIFFEKFFYFSGTLFLDNFKNVNQGPPKIEKVDVNKNVILEKLLVLDLDNDIIGFLKNSGKEIKCLISKRNISVFAHGLESIKEEEALKAVELVDKAIEIIINIFFDIDENYRSSYCEDFDRRDIIFEEDHNLCERFCFDYPNFSYDEFR